MVPDELSGAVCEAERAWKQRVRAAHQLINSGGQNPGFARVLDCSRGFVTLARETFVPKSLEERLAEGVSASPRRAFEIGRALCEILRCLNSLTVHILDLAPDWIACESTPILRIVQIMDPTAVIPAVGVLPEYRGLEAGVADEPAHPERAQVFLVGALVLGLIRGTTGLLRHGLFPRGQSASFAALAGRAQFADEPPQRIAGPLVTDIQDGLRLARQNMQAGEAVEVLRHCLAEQSGQRYPALADLEAAIAYILSYPGHA
jgi:hypothetical protein